MEKMKKCKACGKEIAKSAKVCPNCGKRYGMPGIVKALIVIVIIIACVVGCVGGCANSVDKAVKDTENSYKDVNGKTSFKVNETFENKYIKMTMTEVNTDFKGYSEYVGPSDGNKIIALKFEVENIGDDDQYITIADFNAYADGTAAEAFYFSDDNYKNLSDTISKGKKAVGYVMFEVPKTAKTITVEYDASWLDNNNVEFIIQ